MKKEIKSLQIAEALGRKVLEDIGRQFCRTNRKRSFSRRLERERYLGRVLELKTLGGLSDESRNID